MRAQCVPTQRSEISGHRVCQVQPPRRGDHVLSPQWTERETVGRGDRTSVGARSSAALHGDSRASRPREGAASDERLPARPSAPPPSEVPRVPSILSTVSISSRSGCGVSFSVARGSILQTLNSRTSFASAQDGANKVQRDVRGRRTSWLLCTALVVRDDSAPAAPRATPSSPVRGRHG